MLDTKATFSIVFGANWQFIHMDKRRVQWNEHVPYWMKCYFNEPESFHHGWVDIHEWHPHPIFRARCLFDVMGYSHTLLREPPRWLYLHYGKESSWVKDRYFDHQAFLNEIQGTWEGWE